MNELKTLARGKAGWSETEQEWLWQEVHQASESGQALRSVFDTVAEKTGRKPNSIRNYYYLSIKSGAAPSLIHCQRAVAFVPFDQDELHFLVREVLLARVDGESVRSCVTRLGQGDKARTLRYQNKYRSVLKSHPEYIRQVMMELSAEGVRFGESFTPVRRKRSGGFSTGAAQECATRIAAYGKEGEALLRAVCALLDAAEGETDGALWEERSLEQDFA